MRRLLFLLCLAAAPLGAQASAVDSTHTARMRALVLDSLTVVAGRATGQVRQMAYRLRDRGRLLEAQNLTAPRPARTDTLWRTDTVVVHDTVTASAPPPAPSIVRSILVSPIAATLAIGETVQLWLTPRDSTGKEITSGVVAAWGSSDTSVVRVSAGRIVAVGAGSATISATVGALVSRATITVAAPAPPPPDTTTPPAPPDTTTPPVASAHAAQLPLATPSAAYPTVLRRIAVRAGSSLQAALDTAQYGDELALDAGGTWVGNYVLRNKPRPNGGSIIIRTSGSVPPLGTRLDARDSTQRAQLATLVTPGANVPTLRTEAGACGYRIEGLEITMGPNATGQNLLLGLGDGSTAQSSLAQVPCDLVVAHSFVHGTATQGLRRCIALHSASTAIVDSWLSDCHDANSDAQAIIGYNGPGPYLIENNYLEGSTENIMFGGADPAIPGVVPSDIAIRRNHFTKPLGWKGVWTIKNLLETKSARRVLVEGNVFENTWVGGQAGFAVLFKSSNQSGGCPWCGTTDVTFRNNIVRASPHGINLAAHPETFAVVTAARILVEHNLFVNIGASNGTTGGIGAQLLGELADATLRRNTFIVTVTGSTTHFLSLDLSKTTARASGIVIDGNIATFNGGDPIKCCGVTAGDSSLRAFAPGSYTLGINALIGVPLSDRWKYPAITRWPGTLALTFAVPGTDWHPLAAYVGLGADIDAVMRATAGVVLP